uniref:Uncharacterized protein n=1 Tax=Octopus bimaculoides TaxID=37653 RepID=A0A0L8HSE8_OCTBM
MKSWRILCFVILLITITAADDQSRCCMKGVKRMRKAVFCSEPCCSGYIERVENPPLLGLVVFCEKLEPSDSFKFRFDGEWRGKPRYCA